MTMNTQELGAILQAAGADARERGPSARDLLAALEDHQATLEAKPDGWLIECFTSGVDGYYESVDEMFDALGLAD